MFGCPNQVTASEGGLHNPANEFKQERRTFWNIPRGIPYKICDRISFAVVP